MTVTVQIQPATDKTVDLKMVVRDKSAKIIFPPETLTVVKTTLAYIITVFQEYIPDSSPMEDFPDVLKNIRIMKESAMLRTEDDHRKFKCIKRESSIIRDKIAPTIHPCKPNFIGFK